ncbi:hypothetical protein CgunFtcFv8_024401 [Champsocephalus gunnari]|uniref:Uncharacterized protein n=1 Tax=Champsocephalus gunnari TaxID=52237 RepID=A0AAN8DMD2_CHAGU|nr:hypothetical protein CgunFtcFv8_024401 [Champsocephalus gunnari]
MVGTQDHRLTLLQSTTDSELPPKPPVSPLLLTEPASPPSPPGPPAVQHPANGYHSTVCQYQSLRMF